MCSILIHFIMGRNGRKYVYRMIAGASAALFCAVSTLAKTLDYLILVMKSKYAKET